MLRITQSNSASRAKSYYSTADYYSEGQELVGFWRGEGAKRLGLSGIVDRADWDRLCDNCVPQSGEPLTVRRKADRRVGYDFNFHCPKSVSLLYGITQDERILTAFRDSVEDTMQDIEAESKARVRAGGRNEDRVTGNMVWGEFVHFTARPEDGVPDPHLHAHCFAFNATFDAEEQRWKAGQFGDLKRDAPYFEAVFHARLARRMEELGLATERTAKGWELKGIGADTLAGFSRRTTRIEKLARERGITDPDAKAALGAQTRSGKAKELTMPELKAAWAERLDEKESGDLDALAKRIGQAGYGENGDAAREAVQRAIEHTFERASVVPERTLLTAALRQGTGKASQRTIESLVGQQPMLRGVRRGRRMISTQQVLEEESRMLSFARSGRGACRPLNPGLTRFNREWLNPGQKAAVRHVVESRDRVILVRGVAGSGKTTMMEEAREAIETGGQRVLAFAPSASASRDVLRAAGFPTAETVARLLVDRELQQEARGGVIWIDEAGQMGTRTMREVFELADALDARVVLSGDRRQHGSVERGAALRLLEQEAGLRPAEIREIQRQKDKYRAAVKDLSEDRTEEGFRRLDDLGWIREVADEERDGALAAAYVETVTQGKSALVVSPTHAEGNRITAEIRSQLRKRGLIGSEERRFLELIPANLTLGERRDPVNYRQGDVLVFHQNSKGFRKGQRVLVGEGPLPLDQAERFSVFRSAEIDLSAGDDIRITKGGTGEGGARRLNNGDIFRVRGFTDNGDLLVAPRDEKNPAKAFVIGRHYGHLTHGIVVTSHASQGKTVDRVLIGQSSQSFPASSREQFYVSASRGREQALVFTDDKESLLAAVSRSDERLSATELAADCAAIRSRMARERVAEGVATWTRGAEREYGRERPDYDR
ncbi:Multifunctional conjugation protein TraI [Phycisphaerae bacterium RAS1]|nr:Multifunctional conjugation protein TraI [Phycisphaerae bacterium RAS1]